LKKRIILFSFAAPESLAAAHVYAASVNESYMARPAAAAAMEPERSAAFVAAVARAGVGKNMIGKMMRMVVGRRLAQRHGFNGLAGAAVGLLAPIVLRKAGGFVARKRAARKERKREERMPKYIDKIG
jgi:nitrate/nitrite transporter NarK